ncbi:MAG: hypothetical protein ACQEQO_08395, partial [Thermodesulfobacteriota bacterium]
SLSLAFSGWSTDCHANLLLFIHRKLLGGGVQGLHEEAVDIILHITEDCGMIGIGCYSLAAGDEQLPQGAYILIVGGSNANLIRHGLSHDLFLVR